MCFNQSDAAKDNIDTVRVYITHVNVALAAWPYCIFPHEHITASVITSHYLFPGQPLFWEL